MKDLLNLLIEDPPEKIEKAEFAFYGNPKKISEETELEEEKNINDTFVPISREYK